MEKLLEAAVVQVPALGVLCFLVLSYMKRDEKRDMFIQALHNEHLLARKEIKDIIVENTISNREVVKAVITMQSVLQR